MKEEFLSQFCAVCGARADGLHYGAISCRSCNAFFRRTVVEKADYHCKYNKDCKIDAEARCSCRYCRFNKCIEAGMKVTAVQPRRDPTGSQKDRRKRSLESVTSSTGTSVPSPVSQTAPPTKPVCSQTPIYPSVYTVPEAERNLGSPPTATLSVLVAQPSVIADKVVDLPTVSPTLPTVKREEEEDGQQPSTSRESEQPSPYRESTERSIIDRDEHQKYLLLVHSYRDHIRMMQLNFASIESFLAELSNGIRLRAMEATDVEKLSSTELSGLLFWIEKMEPFSKLPDEDKGNLLKRYSVRKLSLDHFYNAARHLDQAKRGNFVMNNYTFVPPDKTGFELPGDDEKQISAKRETFAVTYERFWRNVIHPFIELNVNDAEIVYLQMMLMWSQTNNEHVTPSTRKVMRTRREWAMRRLFDWYTVEGVENEGTRFGQITLLLGEIETICDMHCQDFQVAKLFEFCDMSQFWYENLCYKPINTTKMHYDPHIIENLKKFTAMSFINKAAIKNLHVSSSPQKFIDLSGPSVEMLVAAGVSARDDASATSALLTPSPEENIQHLMQSPPTSVATVYLPS